MAHTVLARKWRPKKFADLVGQDNAVTILRNILTTQRLHHAYLLTGTRGVGKTTIARIIAKALNCLNFTTNEPCGTCSNCQQIDQGYCVDVIEIDAASNTGVDNIREVLENAQYAPTAAKYKVYIIDEVHMLSKSAFNAMLKTLEEPPAHIVFILATTDPQKVPITVLSRCLQLKLRNLAEAEIEQHLATILNAEQIAFESEALTILATAANGSMRDALSLTDQAIAFANGHLSPSICRQMLGLSDDETIFALLTAISHGQSAELVTRCQSLQQQGANLEQIMEQLNYSLFQIGLAQLSPQPAIPQTLQQLAQTITLQDCQLYFEISNLALEQLRKVDHKYPIFVMYLLRMIAFSLGSYEQNQPQALTTPTVATTATTATIANPAAPQPAALDVNAQVTPNTSLSSTTPEEKKEISPTPPWEETIVEEVTAPAIPQLTAPPASLPAAAEIWLSFVESLDYTQLNPDLAVVLRNSSQIRSSTAHEINLIINDSFRQLVTPHCVDQIEQMLFNRYQCHFDLNFNFTQQEYSGSLKQQQQNQALLRQQQAQAAIENDPIIQDLINNFSAKIVPNSIKPI